MSKAILAITATTILGISAITLGQLPRFPKVVQDISALEAYLTHLAASKNPPGISIAVARNGEIIYRHAVGTVDPYTNVPVTSDTVFHWWSMTKIVTAIAVMQLQEQGRLDIDDPVVKYLPWFVSSDSGSNLSQITLRQLLNHTSGLPDIIPAMIGWVHYQDEIFNQTKILKKLLPDYGKLRFDPVQKSAYTNFGYLVLGVVIEAVSGQTYETYTLEEILKPAGMEMTHFLYTPQMAELEAFGSHPIMNIYTPMLPFLLDMDSLISERKGAIYWFNRVYLDVTPSSGLIGPTDDAIRLLNHYFGSDGNLSLAAQSAMLPDPATYPEDNLSSRPLGWAEFQIGDRTWVQHRGGGPGFATIMRMYPGENISIVVMANGTNLPADNIVNTLENVFISQEK